MATHPLAGQPAPAEMLIDVGALERAYYERGPEVGDPTQLVSFGTSGHRGTSLNGSFNEAHILAITQAICEYRRAQGISGPLFLGKDSHALSGAGRAQRARSARRATASRRVIQQGGGVTPTPVISHAILAHNRWRRDHLADGIVVTPSHNPPADGGFKYNPPDGGPADTDVTSWIQDRANDLLRAGNQEVKRLTFGAALKAATTRREDFVGPYVEDLASVIDLEAIRAAGLKFGVDPLGGAAVGYWAPIADRYGLDLTVVNPRLDPTFGFMTLDHDGKIRMDCSSPYAMAGLVELKDRFDVAWGNDPDADRHGIVTRSVGLLEPEPLPRGGDPLSLAAPCAAGRRRRRSAKRWSAATSSTGWSTRFGRPLLEVPVGFKWFVPGLLDGSCCFGGEESAGASFLRRDGTVWTTDKDGIILGLLAAEITARTGRDPGEHYEELAAVFGRPYYTRIDAPATPEQKDEAQEAVARGRDGGRARRRADHGQADPGAGQQRGHRRPQGRRRQRLVRRAPVGDRKHLQALRGKFQGRGAPGRGRRAGAGDRRPGADARIMTAAAPWFTWPSPGGNAAPL